MRAHHDDVGIELLGLLEDRLHGRARHEQRIDRVAVCAEAIRKRVERVVCMLELARNLLLNLLRTGLETD